MPVRYLPALLALVVAGCGKPAPAPPSQPASAVTAPEGFDTIRLARTACFGVCPVYTLEIARDGKASYAGVEYVKVKGKRVLLIAPADIALLSTVLARSGFWSLKEHYGSEADGCDEMWTDNPSLSISVVRSGQVKTVEFYHGCRGSKVPAAALNWLADTIDYLANIRPLVYDPEAFK